MKVYYIDPQSYNNLSLYDLSLLKNVKDVKVTYYYSDLYQLEEFPNAQCKCRFHYSRKKGVAKVCSYVWSICRIFFDVLMERPDVVHVQWIRIWHVDYLFAFLIRALGVKVVHTAHNILPHLRRRKDEFHYPKYYRLVDAVIVHNERTRQDMVRQMQVPLDKIHVIRHGVLQNPIPNDSVMKRSAELRKHLGFDAHTIIFSSLGVQKSYKGTDDVIKAWMGCPELRDNAMCHLLIGGRNHDIDYSQLEGCSNATTIESMLSDLDFEALLELTDVLLLPYRAISQSGLIFSAINRQVPVLVTDIGGLGEVLLQGNIGWNIGQPSVEELRRKMVWLVAHPEEIDFVRQQSSEFEKLQKVYSWEDIGSKTVALYQDL